ncbi:MAG: hypothetical protein MUF37_04890 [Methanoregulaceae archaeon]|jgi:hypothetical protein|nr:hypothetical protein [Methanoregulaceae archaeon]
MFSLFWIAFILIMIGLIAAACGARGVAGATMKIGMVLMILSFIAAGVVMIFAML